MSVVHSVELAFEFESQLDLFLVVFGVLHVLLFQLESQLLLSGSLLLKGVVVFAHSRHVLLQHLLCVDVSLDLLLEFCLNLVQFLHMLITQFCNEDPVVCLAAIL